MIHELMLARGGEEVAIVAVGGGLAIAIVSIISGVVHRTMVTRQREMSRREIAAYVAEGSMSADDAARLLAEDRPGCGGKPKA